MKFFRQFSIRSLIAALVIISAPVQAFAQSSTKRSSCDMSLDQQVSIIRGLYGQLLGVDATSVQVSLKEADLYRKPISDEWSPALGEAFVNALDWSHSRGSCWTFSTVQDVIDFAEATRSVFFNEDSGLSSQPFNGAFNSLNGWISVTAGMYPQQGCKDKVLELAGQGLIKRDAYCAPIARFDPMNWTS